MLWTKKLEELYWQAKRFDESDFYQSQEYDKITDRQFQLYKKMCFLFGPDTVPLIDDYNLVVGNEMDFECMHFFIKGYRMGQKDPL